jgi:hypothetical protein
MGQGITGDEARQPSRLAPPAVPPAQAPPATGAAVAPDDELPDVDPAVPRPGPKPPPGGGGGPDGPKRGPATLPTVTRAQRPSEHRLASPDDWPDPLGPAFFRPNRRL